jgi:hypothetical protein
MKRRRGRRGFWWWSWILVLTTVGGVVGGYFYGEKEWEKEPKEFVARAKVSFQVRDPFVSKKAGLSIPSSQVADANELEVLDAIKSKSFLSVIATDLDLTGTWGMGVAEAVARLRIAITLDLNQESNELEVSTRLNDPALAAAVTNEVAEAIPTTIRELDEAKRSDAATLLESEARPVLTRQEETRQALQGALASKGVSIKIEPGVDLGVYLNDPDILAAKVAWDAACEDFQDIQNDQAEYRNYWSVAVPPSVVLEKAEVPPAPVGPLLEPFQVRWATRGTAAGLILGSLLMLACWKLFP